MAAQDLAFAFHRAEQTGEPVTYDDAERQIRVRVRLNTYGERQLALVAKGGVSEAVAGAIAVEAGFAAWTTDRSAAALLLTETEAADEPEEVAVLEVPTEGTVLQRVSQRRPLCMADRDEVIRLITAGLMHVTPEMDRSDPCPYRLTDAGRQALRTNPRGVQ